MFDEVPQSATPDRQTEVSVWDYLLVLRRHYLVGVVVFVLVFTVLVGLVLVTPKRYRAVCKVAVIQVDDELEANSRRPMFLFKNLFIQTQLQILQSLPVFEATLKQKGLSEAVLVYPSPTQSLMAWWRGLLAQDNLSQGEAAAKAAPQRSLRRRARLLRSLTTVTPVKDSDVVDIAVTASSPELARDLANGIANVFAATSLEFKREKLTRNRTYLSERLSATREALIDAEGELRAYEERMDATSLEKRIEFVSSLRIQSEGELSDVERQFKEAEAKLKPILSQLSSARKGVAKSSTEAYAGLQQRLLDLRLKRSRLVKVYTPEHPEVRRIEDELALIQSKVSSAEAALVKGESGSLGGMETVLSTYNSKLQELEGLRSREASLKQLAAHYQKRLQDYMAVKSQYDLLARDVEVNRTIYDMLLVRQKEASLKADMQFSDVRVIEPALASGRVVSPKVGRSVLAGLIGAALAGGLAMLIRLLLDRVVHDGKTIEIAVGVPCLAQLPRSEVVSNDKKLGAELGDLADPVTLLGLCREMGTPEDPGSVFLVTSAEPSEGKSSVSSALAVTFAQGGERTLLIDCDLRKPKIHKVLEIPEGSTTVQRLLEEVPETFPDVPGIPGLTVVTAGKIGDLSPVQFLARERFALLLMRLRRKFQKIVLDSPPINVVSDALHLAPLVDRVLLVARAEHTKLPALARAAGSIRDVRGRLAGVVLNDVPSSTYNSYQYGYYSYGSSYRYLYEYRSKEVAEDDAPGASAGS